MTPSFPTRRSSDLSEFTPTSLLVLAGLAKEAGIPAGVINVLTGFGAEVGEPLIRHPDVGRVAFTGGDAAGRRVYVTAAESLKRVSLELDRKSTRLNSSHSCANRLPSSV